MVGSLVLVPINFGDLGHEEGGVPAGLSDRPDSSGAAEPDIIPRRLTVTMIAGSILGIAFWAAVTILLVRYA